MSTATIRRHPLMAIHLAILLILLLGLVQRTGTAYLAHMAGYAGVVVISYISAIVLIRARSRSAAFSDVGLTPYVPPVRGLAVSALLVTASIAVAHWVLLGHVPLLEAMAQVDGLAVNAIRRDSNEVPLLLNYSGHLVLKGLLPFALLVLWYRLRRAFWPVAIIGVVYALSLLQKSPVITLFVPLWVSFIVLRYWKACVLLTAVLLILLVGLILVANPQKMQQVEAMEQHDPQAPVLDDGVQRHGLVGDLALSIARRVFLMPGWTVAAWFEHIPADIPFQHGAAVRPLASLLGIPFVDLSRPIYDMERPELASAGTEGTMPSASFMHGWANFGWSGLLSSAAIMGTWLALVGMLFKDRWRWSVCLGVFPLLAASATALPTVLLTHGWVLTLVLFRLFVRDEKDLAPCASAN
ncbi:MAG: hypothetical protein JNL43_17005 [Flavobacteriales bacterium]|nr:hypothetical protein [Flavobacteriales bacterium]